MSAWQRRKLTGGTDDGRFHAHSYYDIPVFDDTSRWLALYRMTIAGAHPGPDDAVEIGWVDLGDPAAAWHAAGTSRAWSVQQGPMAQWIPGGSEIVWNDLEDGEFVARIRDIRTEARRTLPRPVYAVSPDGRQGLSLNMARLDRLRPGYGYPGGTDARLDERRPGRDGVWSMDLATGDARLILPLARAVRFLWQQLPWRAALAHRRRRYHYWFNHAKISPDGTRFTVKLRFRIMGSGWNENMGFSLTCGMDGNDLALLAPATSHVIWLSPHRLFFWQQGAVRLYEDAERGRELGMIAPGTIDANAHIRQMPDDPETFLFDTPYRREIDVALLDRRSSRTTPIARFTGHEPERGPFRCDLHPVPSPDGRHIVVTSLEDGGRQVYLLTRQIPSRSEGG